MKANQGVIEWYEWTKTLSACVAVKLKPWNIFELLGVRYGDKNAVTQESLDPVK